MDLSFWEIFLEGETIMAAECVVCGYVDDHAEEGMACPNCGEWLDEADEDYIEELHDLVAYWGPCCLTEHQQALLGY